MELVYTATKSRRSNQRREYVFREETPLISLSTRNALALCTTLRLDDNGASERFVFLIPCINLV